MYQVAGSKFLGLNAAGMLLFNFICWFLLCLFIYLCVFLVVFLVACLLVDLVGSALI